MGGERIAVVHGRARGVVVRRLLVVAVVVALGIVSVLHVADAGGEESRGVVITLATESARPHSGHAYDSHHVLRGRTSSTVAGQGIEQAVLVYEAGDYGDLSGYDHHHKLARAGSRPVGHRSAPQAIDDVAAAGARGTTLHGTERIAGAGATRGGVLNSAEIAVVRGGGTAYAQSNGAVARVLQQANGRYSVVVDGNRGLITTFQNLSQNSLDRLAKNYGWTAL